MGDLLTTSVTRCVVFDFDGVLVNTNATKRQAYFDVLRAAGVPDQLIDQAIRDRFDDGRTAVMAEAFRLAGLDAARTDAVVQQYAAIWEEAAANGPEMPGASAVLGHLSGLVPLYVASATPEVALRRSIERRGWSGLLRGVLGRPATKMENVRRILDREGVLPSHLVLVGDRRSDLQAARAVHCRFIGLRTAEDDLAGTRAVMIDRLAELPSKLST